MRSFARRSTKSISTRFRAACERSTTGSTLVVASARSARSAPVVRLARRPPSTYARAFVFFHASDLIEAAAVFLFSGENEDADFERYLEVTHLLDTRAAGRQSTLVQLVERDSPIPNAAWRKRIAKSTMELRSSPTFAVVSESALARGALVAINWLRPPPFPTDAFGTFDEAVAWSERQRGRHLPCLPLLLAEVRSMERTRRGGPESSRSAHRSVRDQ